MTGFSAIVPRERDVEMSEEMSAVSANATWCGQSVERVEDAALLTGRGRFIDDLGVQARHPACRDPALAACPCADHGHPHRGRQKVAGVAAVSSVPISPRISASLVVGVKAPIECWPIAVDRVRYVGEPVAVVVASSRYLAEDALDLIDVDYEPLPPVIDPRRGARARAAVLHEGLRSNLASERSFRYGDSGTRFADAAQARSR